MGESIDKLHRIFRAPEARRYSGATDHQLRYWDRINLLRPSVQSSQGIPGVVRLYSFVDVVQLKALAQLRKAGHSLHKLNRKPALLRERVSELLGEELPEV